MKLSLERTITASFGVALLILSAVGVVSYQSIAQYTSSVALRKHTFQVLGKLEETLSFIKDAETGQRGYVITGEERYLEPYRAGLSQIYGQLYSLRLMTAGDPVQQQRLDRLEPLVADKLAGLQETIDLRRTAGFEAAQQVIASERGRVIMDDIRALVTEMQATEDGSLEASEAVLQASSRAATTIIGLGNLLAFGLVVVAGVIIRRGFAERRRASDELEQRVAQRTQDLHHQTVLYETLLGAVSDLGEGIVFEEGQRLVYVNDAYCMISGYSRSELVHLPDPSAMMAASAADVEGNSAERLLPLKAGAEIIGRYESVITHKTGRRVDLELSAKALPTQAGTRRIIIGRDITERKRAEVELQVTVQEFARSNSELKQFAYVASHDLQEPLRMVASYAKLLSQRYQGKLDADGDEFIAYLVDGATRMQQLINSLLAYSRIGTRSNEVAPVACEAVLDRVLLDLALAIEESSAAVTRTPLPTVMADETQLSQLFQNLISNAVRFHGQLPPKIHISAERWEDSWRFSVRDNGIGMESQYFDRIFVIFQRLHTRVEYPGTGIGLAVCKKIVERHGGRIWVESEPGLGSTFYFSLPQ